MTQMVYKPKTASHLSLEQAQRYGEFLTELDQSNGGLGVTPQMFVEAARPEDSPAHDAFEWNDSKAAERYREEQARKTIRSIVVVVVDQDEEPREERAFLLVDDVFQHPENDEGKTEKRTAYMSLATVASNPDYKTQVIARAKKELQAVVRKIDGLELLTPQVTILNEVIETWPV